jgi:hypothetical protein
MRQNLYTGKIFLANQQNIEYFIWKWRGLFNSVQIALGLNKNHRENSNNRKFDDIFTKWLIKKKV